MLTHVDKNGNINMVDVTDKKMSIRMARAVSTVRMNERAFSAIKDGLLKKGELVPTVKIAAISAAKKTSELIPLTHPLNLTHVDVELKFLKESMIKIYVKTKCSHSTGVEMEALTGATVAALTVYDMIKALDKSATIEGIKLLEKSGGKSGDYKMNEKILEGKIVSINISEKRGVKKLPEGMAELRENFGIVGDAHSGPGNRQISFLSKISIDEMRRKGIELVDGDFGENITFDGFTKDDVNIGDKIKIGDAILEISKIGKECHDGCWIKKKVGDCIMPREGFFASVVKGGTIKDGDIMELFED